MNHEISHEHTLLPRRERAGGPEAEALSRELAGAYRRCFATEDGQRVLEDLRRKFGLEGLVFKPAENGRYDYLAAALRDGQRRVMSEIEGALRVAGAPGKPLL